MFDFFERQEQAQRNTVKLLALFVLAIGVVALALYLVVATGRRLAWKQPVRVVRIEADGAPSTDAFAHREPPPWWDPAWFAVVAAATACVIGGASAWKLRDLRSGHALAERLGGRLVSPRPEDARERTLVQVTEEMAIAAGCPVPTLYVLDHERAINAFAAGFHPSDAVIGVTWGALQALDRAELQGVLAHEFSHILYDDMRLNLRLIGVLYGIEAIGRFGRLLARGSLRTGHDRRGHVGITAGGLALWAVGSLGLLLGRLIKAAVLREREFLADAAAVQFTRNPAGLAGALRKIGGLPAGSVLLGVHAAEVNHLMIAPAAARRWFDRTRWFATHPPLEERIRRLDPRWDGSFPRVALPPPQPEQLAMALWAFERAHTTPASSSAANPVSPKKISRERIFDHVRGCSPLRVNYAAALIHDFPAPLAEAAHDVRRAQALVFALTLSPDPAVRARQCRLLADSAATPGATASAESSLVAEVERLAEALGHCEPGVRLPLLDLAQPALSSMTRSEYETFAEQLRRASDAAGEDDLPRFVLRQLVLAHLRRRFCPDRTPLGLRVHSVAGFRSEIALLLSALAHHGHDEPAAAEQAYRAGLARLRFSHRPPAMLPPEQVRFDRLERALERLERASVGVRRRMLQGCAWTVAHDGEVTLEEAELLRAIAERLDCPLPPFADSRERAPLPAVTAGGARAERAPGGSRRPRTRRR